MILGKSWEEQVELSSCVSRLSHGARATNCELLDIGRIRFLAVCLLLARLFWLLIIFSGRTGLIQYTAEFCGLRCS